MSTLNGKAINQTFDGLLKTENENALPATGRVIIQDGLGNNTALSIGRAGEGIAIDGPISGITNGLVSSKEFSLVSISDYVEGTGFSAQFLIQGEDCDSIKTKIYRADSKLPIYTATISSPTNGTVYDIAGSYPLEVGQYTLLFEAVFSDNTVLYDMSNAVFIKEEQPDISLESLTLQFVTDPANSSYVDGINQYYLYLKESIGSLRPASVYINNFFIEGEAIIQTTPYDLIIESDIEEPSGLNITGYQATLISNTGSRQFISLYQPSFEQYYNIERLSSGRYRLKFIFPKSIFQNNITTYDPFYKTADLEFYIPFYKTIIDRFGRTSRIGRDVLQKKFDIDILGLSLTNEILVNSVQCTRSFTSLSINVYFQNVNLLTGITYEVVEVSTQNVLHTQLINEYPINATQHSIGTFSTPMSHDVNYELRYSGQYLDGTSFLSSLPFDFKSASASLVINSSSSTIIECVGTFTNWMRSGSSLNIILNNEANEFVSRNIVIPNSSGTYLDDDIDGILVNYNDTRYVGFPKQDQVVPFNIIPTAPLPSGNYTVRIYGYSGLDPAVQQDLDVKYFTIL